MKIQMIMKKRLMSHTFKKCDRLNRIQEEKDIVLKLKNFRKIAVVETLLQKIAIKKKERMFLRVFRIWEILRNRMYYFTKLSSAKI